MAVSTSFVVCPDSEWTAICQQNPTRTAMMVQLLAGDAVLGVNTNGPMVVTAFGSFPCGVWTSLTDGNSLNPFRMSAAIDADLITQEWFIWPVGGLPPVPAAPVSVAFGTVNTFGGAAPTLIVPFSEPAGVMIAAVFTIVDGAVDTTATSGLAGLLASSANATTPSETGVFGQVDWYTWIHTGGPDTLTLVGSAAGLITCQVWNGNLSTADQSGSATGTNFPVSVSTGGAIAAAPEFAFAGFSSVNGPVNFTEFAPPFVSLVSGQVIDNNGATWNYGGSYAPVTAVAVVTATLSPIAFTGDWCAAILTLTVFGGTAPASTVTVIESFDIVDSPAPQQYLTVPLPTLNAAAIESLKELQAQILAKESVMEVLTDAG